MRVHLQFVACCWRWIIKGLFEHEQSERKAGLKCKPLQCCRTARQESVPMSTPLQLTVVNVRRQHHHYVDALFYFAFLWRLARCSVCHLHYIRSCSEEEVSSLHLTMTANCHCEQSPFSLPRSKHSASDNEPCSRSVHPKNGTNTIHSFRGQAIHAHRSCWCIYLPFLQLALSIDGREPLISIYQVDTRKVYLFKPAEDLHSCWERSCFMGVKHATTCHWCQRRRIC